MCLHLIILCSISRAEHQSSEDQDCLGCDCQTLSSYNLKEMASHLEETQLTMSQEIQLYPTLHCRRYEITEVN